MLQPCLPHDHTRSARCRSADPNDVALPGSFPVSECFPFKLQPETTELMTLLQERSRDPQSEHPLAEPPDPQTSGAEGRRPPPDADRLEPKEVAQNPDHPDGVQLKERGGGGRDRVCS